jgi:hypothetical protein
LAQAKERSTLEQFKEVYATRAIERDLAYKAIYNKFATRFKLIEKEREND